MSLQRRASLLSALLVPLAGFTTACAPTQPLVLAGHPWPGYEPMFLARNMGLMPQALTLLESATFQESIDAIKSGRADGIMLTLDEILQLRSTGIDLEVVLIFNVSKGADVVLARPEIQTLKDLKNASIGVEDTALGTLMLTMVLEKAGLTLSDVKVKRIAFEQHEQAWRQAEVQAIVTYEPVAGRLRSRGANLIISTRELPETIFDVLAVRPERARAMAKTLMTALKGHFTALTHLRQNPWDAAYRVAPRLGITAEELISSLRGLELPDLVGNRRYLSDGSGQLKKIAEKLSPIMLQAKLIDRPVDTRALFSERYLPQEQT